MPDRLARTAFMVWQVEINPRERKKVFIRAVPLHSSADSCQPLKHGIHSLMCLQNEAQSPGSKKEVEF